MERSCINCLKTRFVKPEEDNRSFCVSERESHTIEANVRRAFGITTTHKETTKACDHPKEFEAKS